MFKKWLLALCVSGFALNVCAAPDGSGSATANAPANANATAVASATGSEASVRKAILSLAPDATIASIQASPIPGFYQVITDGQLVYVSADGKFLLNGDLIDVARKKNISNDGWASFRKAELAKVPASDRIVFAPANPRYRVTVFTDVNCAYCRALHEHVAEFNKAGIALEYVAWPRDGVTNPAGRNTETYNEMVSVWCASNRNAAFTAAKEGHMPKSATCANPVKQQFDLGVKLGITGTPTIIASDGTMLGGYITPEEMLRLLSKGS
ncbi:DsbC family protein [Dyella solisilvae]|uniref:Thiol:disulfide interchange protein n=1 Tax=Dyella solisilvae TaxID=1920168 RepID=A0A370KCQ1_9GAMM|nr:DsbC family protein [Dyella solisilvae]RDJ00362.1 DsbC family protein [Dyella solisilvae]